MLKLVKKVYKRINPNYRIAKEIKSKIALDEKFTNTVEEEIKNLSLQINSLKETVQKIYDTPNINEKMYMDLVSGDRIKNVAYEFLMLHGRDLQETLWLKKLYNNLKSLETVRFLPFLVERIDQSIMDLQLNDMKARFTEEFLVLTDLEYFSEKWHVITKDDVKNYVGRKDVIFVLVFNRDWLALDAVKVIEKYEMKYLSIPNTVPMARFYHTDKESWETLLEECNNAPIDFYFCPVDFENIFQALLATADLTGVYVEIGTYMGSSARAALRFMRKKGIKRDAYFLDVYEGFTYEEAQNSEDAYWFGTHTNTSVELVREYLNEFPDAKIIKNNIITDDIPDYIDKICVCNIDVDMYDAVKAALYKVRNKIVSNGIIIAEDYGHTPLLIGAQKAVREFMADYGSEFIPIYLPSGQMFLIKK